MCTTGNLKKTELENEGLCVVGGLIVFQANGLGMQKIFFDDRQESDYGHLSRESNFTVTMAPI